MGMNADVVAIGPYSPDIANCLEYPPDFYRATQPGALVIVTLFGISEGSTASRDFASHLGITDPWDFNQHKIDPTKVDTDGLAALFKTLCDGEEYAKNLGVFCILRDRGFQFIFRPNG